MSYFYTEDDNFKSFSQGRNKEKNIHTHTQCNYNQKYPAYKDRNYKKK